MKHEQRVVGVLVGLSDKTGIPISHTVIYSDFDETYVSERGSRSSFVIWFEKPTDKMNRYISAFTSYFEINTWDNDDPYGNPAGLGAVYVHSYLYETHMREHLLNVERLFSEWSSKNSSSNSDVEQDGCSADEIYE